MGEPDDIHDLIARLKTEGRPFAIATVVRTVAATAAKAGAKSIILEDRSIAGTWIGGGCARRSVLDAADKALQDGIPRLISIQPEANLTDQGVRSGDEKDGISFARNMCPSEGTMDIFVEPVLPLPELVIHGQSPVADALRKMGAGLGYVIADRPDTAEPRPRFVVVATQGQGDLAALTEALSTPADYLSFVGSRRKFETLRKRLAGSMKATDLEIVRAPAGLDIGAITPEEIALSILAEITGIRRKGQRG